MGNNISKFAPKSGFPDLPVIQGLKLSTCNANISKGKKLDLLLIEATSNSTICGLFTKSETCSHAVDWSRQNLKRVQKQHEPIALVVNSGNANVFTGLAGKTTVRETILSVAKHINTSQENIFVASTGVIGEHLDYKKITTQIQTLTKNAKSNAFFNAAEAIMTTDTYPKGFHTKLTLEKTNVKINGIAKGSGMIAPNMGTMLVFIFSDIAIEKNILQQIMADCSDKTFNCITVDSDTSTSDSLFVITTGTAKMQKITSLQDPRAIKFQKYLYKTMFELAHLVIKDGEGITKFIEVTIKGAKTYENAVKIGKSIAESPLVKTAFAGEDPNWGRVVMAIGKSGIKINKEQISICFGDNIVAVNGSISENYNEKNVANYMKNDSLNISVDLGLGKEKASIYTCDLTHGYISINADYRS